MILQQDNHQEWPHFSTHHLFTYSIFIFNTLVSNSRSVMILLNWHDGQKSPSFAEKCLKGKSFLRKFVHSVTNLLLMPTPINNNIETRVHQNVKKVLGKKHILDQLSSCKKTFVWRNRVWCLTDLSHFWSDWHWPRADTHKVWNCFLGQGQFQGSIFWI